MGKKQILIWEKIDTDMEKIDTDMEKKKKSAF